VRRTFLVGLVASAVVVVVGIETLSAVRELRRDSLVILGMLAAAAFVFVQRGRAKPSGERGPITPFDVAVIASLGIAGACTLIVALWAPPNNWDSMTYHMARIAEWYDHGSVAFYPTAIDRQLWQPPFAEYLILVTYGVLERHDYLANLPQWIAAAGAAVAAMEIARLIGATKSGQRIAALVVATTPTVVLEASSTQNDLLAALWLSIAAYLALAEYIEPRGRLADALAFGAAFGLAIGTKGTALPIGLPWLLVFFGASVRTSGLRIGVRQAALAAIAILALNAGQYARNLDAFGNVLGPAAVQQILRPESFEPSVVLSNLAANASIHLGTPWASVNALLERAVAVAHAVIGLDLKRLYPYFGGFRILPWSTDEGLAGNPLQFLLVLVGVALVFLAPSRVRVEQRVMMGALAAGALLIGITVRWQPFNGRLHLPLFVLAAPCIALMLSRFRGPWMPIVVAVLAAAALPSLLSNTSRPLLPWGTVARGSVLRVPREEQYFANRPEMYRPYATLIRHITDTPCTRIGLFADYDSWEYPLWQMGRAAGLTFAHAGVPRRPHDRGGPCLWIGLDPAPEWRPSNQLHLLWQDGPLSLWQ
jgi:hypothetical protein